MRRCALVAKQYERLELNRMWNVEGGMGCARGGDEELDECDMDKFGTLDSNEETIAILGDRW